MRRSHQQGQGSRAILTLLVTVGAVMASVPLRPRPAAAAGVVGTGTPESCTGAALDAALAGGGLVTFDCGADPVTIDISAGTSTKTISADTTIDGGGLVTISAPKGSSIVAVFVVNRPVTFTVRNLTIADAPRGGIYNNNGTVSVTATTFTRNSVAGVYNDSGTLSVTASTFASNSGTTVYGNPASGGITNVSGSVTVSNSTFTTNSSTSDRVGGGISNESGLFAVTNSTFTDNAGLGAISNETGTLVVRNSTFTGNAGGGISNAGTLTVTNSTLSGNIATGGGGIRNGGTSTVINSTFVSNDGLSMYSRGGGILTYGMLTVTNCTFVDNIGGNIEGLGPVTATNSIFVNRYDYQGNCDQTLTDLGHNLDDGTSCGFSAATGSLSNTDPEFDPAGLADNGGFTQTIALLAGSPAIDTGDPEVCANAPVNGLDQRGYLRLGDGDAKCSIGAYEADAIPVASCVGDCNSDASVAINELVLGVDIALAVQPVSACPAFMSPDALVDIAQLITGVNNALNGCESGGPG